MLYQNLKNPIAKKLCYRCLYLGIPKQQKGKKKWKGHIFFVCAKCSSHVFFGEK